ncbi:uncharacterized protein MONOS_13838 [Monocercomonoides exilis]|uniref:uncharacterized protein n=1 Tax=Monocercomonoides exilis TaxID=2049356 RepID=UPI00355A53DC|nr:hypothetical protein MONOS_13838 [Monocercomonoides exilis]|eukprot:MONOS_13838.1-p1 / transcript=MONOS_13838.1 / gene=MONOS_13838 / organism=Monocercomonoides_exilis_PA203 / gene_product=unspecified product / transcript_product=unspecified product / location=Mono_scaffold00891:13453-14879(+) / protein_length=434 / sequence_SO=supercontig / SO=protein_coding / is_pseudo=false
MEMYDEEKSNDDVQEQSLADKFLKLFSELEECTEEGQKQKILELNKLIDEMNNEEFRYVFTKELFNKIDQMIEEDKLTMGNAILLLKHMGYCNALLNIKYFGFLYSSLKRRFREMIDDEEKKKEKRNEKLLTELCECYLLLNIGASSQLISVCVPCLLKAALKKDENEEAQKEVEMALLALSCIFSHYKIEKDLYLNEIKEIIQHHQGHRNLSRLAYQSAWSFLVFRYCKGFSSEIVIVNELHFIRDATKELEELSKSVDWKKKKEEMGETERKAMDIISRWIRSIYYYLKSCHLWNEEYVGLISRIVDVLRASRDNHSEIGEECIQSFEAAAENRAVKLDALLKSGAIDAALEEIPKSTLNERMTSEILRFFHLISMRFKGKGEVKTTEEERKELKRKIFKKMEEEGFEDIIISFYEKFRYIFANHNVFINL